MVRGGKKCGRGLLNCERRWHVNPPPPFAPGVFQDGEDVPRGEDLLDRPLQAAVGEEQVQLARYGLETLNVY